MNTERITKLLRVIRKSDIAYIHDPELDYCPVATITIDGNLTGEPDNQVIMVTWNNKSRGTYITEEGLDNAIINGSSITLLDYEGSKTVIRLYNNSEIDVATEMS